MAAAWLCFNVANALAAQPVEPPVRIFVAGDVLLGRGVAASQLSSTTELEEKKHLIASADLAFCNLECAVSLRRATRNTQLLAKPASMARLKNAGFDIVSLANNHALDAGESGLRATQNALQNSGIAFAGAQSGDGEWRAWRTKIRKRQVAFLAASAWGPFQAGHARVRPLVGSKLVENVRALNATGAVVIVSLHWGAEYAPQPDAEQRRIARALIDAGASAVVGHHPHVAQQVETYRGRPIFYSLGNFVFDRTPRAQSGSAATIFIDVYNRVTWRCYTVRPQPRLKAMVSQRQPVRLAGRFLRADTRPQSLVWSRLDNGAHQLRLLRRDGERWRTLAQGFHASIYDLHIGDVDGDGRDEILAGLNQRSKLDTATRRRLHIYYADARRGFRPLWRGSALSRPFRRFVVLPREKGIDVVAEETSTTPAERGFERLSVYRWNGFGLRVLWSTPVRGRIRALRTGKDAQGSYIRLRQSTVEFDRTLTLRPSYNDGSNFQAVVTPV